MPSRGSTTQRGYGADHQRMRRQWEPKVKAGLVDCARCGHAIRPDEPWELDHADDRTTYLGPSHLTCNRHEGGVKGAAVTNAHWQHTSRAW